MLRRRHYAWAIGNLAILATLLGLHHPGGFKASSTACVSAPSAPRACFESAQDGPIQNSHFAGCGDTPTSLNLRLRSLTGYFGPLEKQTAVARSPLYGSLYRRPPPSLT
jgi:hypothetical protein